MSCAVSTFSREHILLWLPCRSHCQRSGELPSHEQMPSCDRKGLARSPLTAAIPLKQVLIHFGRHWVELCVAKRSFPGISSESNPSRGWDWPPVYTIPSVYLTSCSFRYSRSQTGRETLHYPYSLGSGLKSYTQPHLIAMLPGVQEGGCLSEEAYQFMRKKKSAISAALKSHGAANTETSETRRMHQVQITWLPTKGFLQWAHLRSSHQDDVLWLSN